MSIISLSSMLPLRYSAIFCLRLVGRFCGIPQKNLLCNRGFFEGKEPDGCYFIQNIEIISDKWFFNALLKDKRKSSANYNLSNLQFLA